MVVQFPPFRPHPWVRGGHLQTILGSYFFHGPVSYSAALQHVRLPDGDQIAVHDDRPEKWQPHDPVALLVHGLGGSHLSGYMQRCASKLTSYGVRVFRMDLRGCGAGAGLARQLCHAGRSEDVAAVLTAISQWTVHSPTTVIGFSMGANMVLKLAGEWGAEPPENVKGVMAVAPPVDLEECCTRLQSALQGMYDRTFVKGLRRYIASLQSLTPDASLPNVPANVRRIREFDDHVTAPLSGFRNAEDYYEQSSSGPYLTKIRIPTLIVAAEDDPIIPIDTLTRAKISDDVQMVVASGGGHLGYIAAKSRDPDCRWLDWRVVEWVLSRMPDHLGSAQARIMQIRLKTQTGLQHSV